MTIIWKCPHCGRRLRLGRRALGTRAPCPECNRVLDVPATVAAAVEGQRAELTHEARAMTRDSGEVWYAIVAGEEVGPLTANELRGMARDGRVSPTDRVRKGPDGRWVPSRNVRGLLSGSASNLAGEAVSGATQHSYAVEAPPPEAWYVRTSDGQTFGPATRAQLDTWVAEGRVAAENYVFCQGWKEWVTASTVFPSLATPPAVASAPRAPPVSPPASPVSASPVVATAPAASIVASDVMGVAAIRQLHDMLAQGHNAERAGRPDDAHRLYGAVLERDPLNRDAVLGMTRLVRASRNLGDLPARIGALIQQSPWDFEAVEILCECDPGVAARLVSTVQAKRREGPPSTVAVANDPIQWASLAHSYDRHFLHEISRAPMVAHAVAQQQARWSDASYKRELLLKTVRIGPDQMPQLWALHLQAARRLGIQPPELYVKSDHTLNASAGGAVECYVCLNTGLLNVLSDDALLFVLGHEMGHIIHRHVLHYQVADQMAQRCFQSAEFATNVASGFLAWGGAIGVLGGLIASASASSRAQEGQRILENVLRWQQFSEFSADRAGLIACRSVDGAVNALAKILGITPTIRAASRFGAMFNLEAFLEQHDEAARHFAHVAPAEDYLSSHPYTAHRIRILQAWELSWGFHRLIGTAGESTSDHTGQRLLATGPRRGDSQLSEHERG